MLVGKNSDKRANVRHEKELIKILIKNGWKKA